MCVCVAMCMCACVCVCACVYIYIYICMCSANCTHAHMFSSMVQPHLLIVMLLNGPGGHGTIGHGWGVTPLCG